jgi:ligand-binding SRPBCC domain-containing protein
MRRFTFESTQVVPTPLEEVFAFFSDARNLEKITPPWLSFHVVTPGPIEMREGTIIDYELRVHGLPLRWRSEITRWDPPHAFVDEQLRGPYREWVHLHTFEEAEGGTRIGDRVTYAVPGGRLVERLLVRRDIERIFAHRSRVIRDLLAG